MMLLRTPILAAVLTAALAVGAPAANANTAPTYPFSIPGTAAGFQWPANGALSVPTGGCTTNTVGQGRTGGNTVQSCLGAGLSFIGPSTSISNVVGPTIIAAAFTGSLISAGGNVAIGP